MPDATALHPGRVTCCVSGWEKIPATADRPLFIIADIHGMAEHLAALQNLARVAIQAHDLQNAAVVRLGDLINRGPSSMRAVDIARRGVGLSEVTEVTLTGNHEQTMLLALLSPPGERRDTCMAKWRKIGGLSVLAELGLPDTASPSEIRAAIGAERIDFLQRTRISYSSGDITCVHAGLNPAYDTAEFLKRGIFDWPAAREESPFWIRQGFLDHRGPLPSGRFVVHGHTIERSGPVLRHHRLGLDLGSCRTGRVAMAQISKNMCRMFLAESML